MIILFKEFLKDLLISGLQKSKIKQILRQQNLSIPEAAIEELSQQIEDEFKQLISKELPETLLFLFIDCKVVECIKDSGKIGKVCIYQVFAIDQDTNRLIIHFEVSEEPENSKKWISIFSKLIERGLRKVFFIVSDNLSGIVDAVKNVFPDSLHQLCIVHLKRNIYKHLSREHAQEFNDAFEIIKFINSPEDTVNTLQKICDKLFPLYPHFMSKIKQDAQLYLNFIRLPKNVRKFVYSTNLVEGLNNVAEQIRKSCGGYFRSSNHILLSYAIWYHRIKQSKWSVAHPWIKAYLRDINSLFFIATEANK